MNTGCTRHFLGWDQPALDSAAQWIFDRFVQNSELDLSDVHLVLPGRRAARTLLGNLVDLCESQGIVLIPPITMTPLEIPAATIGRASEIEGMGGLGRHASKLSRKLAWIQALQDCDPSMLAEILPAPPETQDLGHWIGIGGWIAGVSDELCDAGLRMSEVATRGIQILDESETVRWDALGEIQNSYEQILAGLGVVDDRLVTLDHVFHDDETVRSGRRFICIGMPELGSTARGAIERAECEVDSLVFAPESLAERFDEFGCVVTDQWIRASLEIDEGRIVFEESPASMCERAMTRLALHGSRSGADALDTSSCVIGLADESLIGPLRQIASMGGPKLGIEIHAPIGRSALSTPPGQLVELIQAYLGNPSFDTLALLARHPDMELALTAGHAESDSDAPKPKAWWLTSLDLIRQNHVLTSSTVVPNGTKASLAKDAEFVVQTVAQLLGPLIPSPGADLPLDDWAGKLSKTLELIYLDIELDIQSEHDRSTIEGLGSIRAVLDEISDAKLLGQCMPVTSAHTAVALILDRLGETMLAEPLNRDAIEAVGWLELPLDPSPLCVVVGMSESCVPGSITHDPLLPGSLRDALGMTTNEDRLARDTFLMASIHASRDAVFMCARNGEKNDPVTPSRLLLRVSGESLAKRVGRFVDPSEDCPSLHSLAMDAKPGKVDRFKSTLRVCEDFVVPVSMRVTDFDTFLRSPAQWYLERHLGLGEIDIDIRELGPAQLGTLIHSILDSFGKDPAMRDLDDPDAINAALLHLLDQETVSQYGTKPAAAVIVQTRLLHYRLGWFATQQSQRRRDGWAIAYTEWSPDKAAPPSILVDGDPMELRGKIDRIDRHEDGRLAIIDYKTGRIVDARKAHQTKDAWTKLQLPLYRFLVRQLASDQEIVLGYAGLPANAGEDVWQFADWDQDELKSADEAACDVVRNIRKMSAGDKVEMGDSPPDNGILGFLTGQRFDTGGNQWIHEEESTEAEVGV
ncbi:MAG: PD-(D/E)XK nuclease family protein [Phycisphaerales bacterium]|nr:PD-(D/E)XK nuclease family protein [Phycisphaerales bacterium]